MTNIDGSFASCRLGIIRTCVSPLKLTCFTPVALFTVRFIADPMLRKALCPHCRRLVLVVLILCAVLIDLYSALLVASFTIVVRSSSARVMLLSKNSSSFSRSCCSVFLTCLRLSCCCRRFCLVLAMALASFVRCTMTCSLSFDSTVGSLETDRME